MVHFTISERQFNRTMDRYVRMYRYGFYAVVVVATITVMLALSYARSAQVQDAKDVAALYACQGAK